MARYKFDQIAINSTTKKKPTDEDKYTYLGLEHLDSGNLQITRFGSDITPIGDKLLMKKGDVLFGKRRAYQKKVAIAPFDGIFSAHGMVLRPKEEVIHQDFFPFFISSDYFLDKAISISVGGLSPTINWKDLKELEFDLPTMDEQKRLAKILWAAEDIKQKYNVAIKNGKIYLDTFIDEHCWNNNVEASLLIDIVKTTTGKFIDGNWIESKDQSDDGIRLLQLADIGRGDFLNKSNKYISEETFQRLNCTEVLIGDILISRMADPIGRSCIVEETGSKMITAVDCCIIRLDNKTNFAEYWNSIFNSSKWYKLIRSLSSGTTRIRISRKNLESISIYVPSAEEQLKFLETIKSIKKQNAILSSNLSNIITVQQKMINSIIKRDSNV